MKTYNHFICNSINFLVRSAKLKDIYDLFRITNQSNSHAFIVYNISFTFNYSNKSALAQPFVPTVKHRDLVIDLGNGIQTNTQLTIPAVGNGPFPGVLLVPGSGATDMNVTISPDVKPFWQIAQYLSERGFAVLRYDKRGVGDNGTIIDT